jgi:hypothetical protein
LYTLHLVARGVYELKHATTVYLHRHSTKVEQIMEMLKTMQERMNASHNEMLDKIEARMGGLLTDINDTRKETMTCQGNTKARLEGEEPTSVDMRPEAVQQVPREDATVMPVGGPKKRRRDRNPDARHRGKPKERTQGKDGCRKNLVAARRGTTRRAAVARRRRNFCTQERNTIKCGLLKQLVAARKGTTRSAAVARRRGEFVKKDRTRNQAERGTPERRKDEERLWKGPECNSGIRDRGLRQKRELKKTLRRALVLEIGKQAIEISSGLHTIKNWTLWRGRPPPK